MSMLKYNSEQNVRLDDEFYEMFHRIKEILNIKSVDNVKLCESWLEKLKNNKNQRVLRNKYIFQLYRLIKSGSLNGIFKEVPSNSALVPLNYSDKVKSDSLSSVIETSSSEGEKNASKQIKYPKEKIFIDRHKSDSSILSDRCRASSYKIQLASSKKRIIILADVINELHQQNERLRQKLKKSNHIDNESVDFNKIIEKQKYEMEEFRSRLEAADFDKKELEKNHMNIIEQYKNTMLEQISKFKSCLYAEQSKNNELIDIIAILTQKIEALKLEKQNEAEFIEKKYSDELESNKCHYEVLLKKKEQELQIQMRIVGQLKEQIASVMSKENKLQDLLTDQYSTIKEEFIKIRNEMELANQHHQRYLEDKISKLKKNLLKVEISKHKLASLFKKKIFKVLKTKEFEIATLRMQIEGQKSETVNSVNLEKQSEINNIFLNQTEERYKEVWTCSEAVVDDQKQQFLKKIIGLESQISDIKNGLMEKEFYV